MAQNEKAAPQTLSRRSFIAISAGMCAVQAAAGSAFAAATTGQQGATWTGVALGAQASLTIIHPSRSEAQDILDRAVREIRRLESLFNLYDAASTISQLNKDGKLTAPSADFLSLFSYAQSLSQATFGAFDMTVQPLWHEKGNRGNVSYRDIDVGVQEIRFAAPGMAVTMNGIAQGYITDKVTQLLQSAGLENILVNVGETRGHGVRDGKNPWKAQVGFDQASLVTPIRDQAIAVTRAQTLAMDENAHAGYRLHLFDPLKNQATDQFQQVAVKAPTAMLADALSTALAVLPEQRWGEALRNFDILDVQVAAIRRDGSKLRL